MRRPPLLIAIGTDGIASEPHLQPPAINCPVCTERFGIPVIASVTLQPTHARRHASGRVVLDENNLICDTCLRQGRGIVPIL